MISSLIAKPNSTVTLIEEVAMFKWILLFLALAVFVVLTFAGAMLDTYFILSAKVVLLGIVVASLLYYAKEAHQAAHSDTETQ